jgi:hypothetical protein
MLFLLLLFQLLNFIDGCSHSQFSTWLDDGDLRNIVITTNIVLPLEVELIAGDSNMATVDSDFYLYQAAILPNHNQLDSSTWNINLEVDSQHHLSGASASNFGMCNICVLISA